MYLVGSLWRHAVVSRREDALRCPTIDSAEKVRARRLVPERWRIEDKRTGRVVREASVEPAVEPVTRQCVPLTK